MGKKLTIQDLNVRHKKVLVRVDFNVPLDDAGRITDDTRIQRALPTIRYLLENEAALILMSHLGRPKGKPDPAFSLSPVANQLSLLLNQEVKMAPDSVGEEVKALAEGLTNGEVLLLENLRFHEAETKPESNPLFAEQLASLADCYVNDAFGTAHRAHSSTATITRFFPDQAAAGFLLSEEINYLGEALAEPKRPFVALIGGAKVSSKLGVLKALLERVDTLVIGGGMAFTFLKAQGHKIGSSLVEDELIETAKEVLEEAEKRNVRLLIPEDIVAADRFDSEAESKVVSSEEGVPEGWMGLDIGPRTRQEITQELASAATVLWNGPMGVFELPSFAKGTAEVAQALAKSSAVSIVGGGDSVAAVNQLNLADQMTHISTGGGASLEYIENGELPGINSLSDRSIKISK